MISTPTTLVLGAGASMHLNYPLGFGLVRWLAEQRGADHEVPDAPLPMVADGSVARCGVDQRNDGVRD